MKTLDRSGDKVVWGHIETDSTYQNGQVTVPINGDANRNARVKIDFRRKGDDTWYEALDLERMENDKNRKETMTDRDSDYKQVHEYSGSIFGLAEGTTYEVRVIVSDPDVDGGKESVLGIAELTTRAPSRITKKGTTYTVDTDMNVQQWFRDTDLGPGDIVIFEDGDYTEDQLNVGDDDGRPTLTIKDSGDWNNMLVIRARNPGKVSMPLMTTEGDNIHVDGINLYGNPAATKNGEAPYTSLSVSGHNNYFSNMEISNSVKLVLVKEVNGSTFDNIHFNGWKGGGILSAKLPDGNGGEVKYSSDGARYQGESLEFLAGTSAKTTGHVVKNVFSDGTTDGISYGHSNIDIIGLHYDGPRRQLTTQEEVDEFNEKYPHLEVKAELWDWVTYGGGGNFVETDKSAKNIRVIGGLVNRAISGYSPSQGSDDGLTYIVRLMKGPSWREFVKARSATKTKLINSTAYELRAIDHPNLFLNQGGTGTSLVANTIMMTQYGNGRDPAQIGRLGSYSGKIDTKYYDTFGNLYTQAGEDQSPYNAGRLYGTCNLWCEQARGEETDSALINYREPGFEVAVA